MTSTIKDIREMTASRFTRSIHLDRDIWDKEALLGYVVTTTARQVISRIGAGYRSNGGSRAWTLTGPYGTGKSAFANFVAHVLAPASSPGTAEARELLSSHDGQLTQEIIDPSAPRRGLWPVTVTGTREPLHLALLRALHSSLTAYDHTGTSSTKRQVARYLHQAQKGEIIGTSEITELFASALEAISHGSSSAAGLFLIIDELGKLLEYAAAHPSGSDLYILQSLAEYAARASKPFVILGILHQDFAVYTDRLSMRERAEWDKVRGRFEDLVFVEPADEVLRLIAKARSAAQSSEHDGSLGSRRSRADREAFAKLTEAAWKLDLAPAGMAKGEFLRLLSQCLPLHPMVAVLLGRLFRKLAQNERSVFSFLESSEPLALRDFLRRAARSPGSVYRLDMLHDYLLGSLGKGLYVHSQGKRWAEIETVLGRLSDASALEVLLVKTVGMLGAIGAAGSVSPTREVLAFAAAGTASHQQVDEALANLERRSAVVLRRYNKTYSLWEGSDIDLDERIRAATGRVEGEQNIAALATRFLRLRPLVARRHSFQTGALRYFQTSVVGTEQLQSVPEQTPGGADGTLLIVLPHTAEDAQKAQQLAEVSPLRERNDLLIVMPGDSRVLADSVRECACLEWVRSNTPELEGDATARRELRARLTAMRRRMEAAFAAILDPTKLDYGSAVWVCRGRQRHFRSQREVNEFLSRMCDQLYAETPRLHNELINRRELSSAVAAARRNLIEAMIERGEMPSLGISGTPPEMSMYLSLLAVSGILRCDDVWKIADFGISKLMNNPVTGYTFQGAFTAPWAPPEQITGAPAHPSADVYAWARVMGYMLTGKTSADKTLTVEPAWRSILEPCVDFHPENRPDVSSLLAALEQPSR